MPELAGGVAEPAVQAGFELGESAEALAGGVRDLGQHRADDLVSPAGGRLGQGDQLDSELDQPPAPGAVIKIYDLPELLGSMRMTRPVRAGITRWPWC